jgi:hypothetical protein
MSNSVGVEQQFTTGGGVVGALMLKSEEWISTRVKVSKDNWIPDPPVKEGIYRSPALGQGLPNGLCKAAQ